MRALRAMSANTGGGSREVARNATVREIRGVEPIELVIMKRRLVYASKVFRVGPSSLRGLLTKRPS